MIIRRASKAIKAFTLSATDENDAPVDLHLDAVDVAIKPLGEQPSESDWLPCDWSTVNPNKVRVLFNLPDGFDISDSQAWPSGTYWWFVRPHDSPEEPVLDGSGYIEIA